MSLELAKEFAKLIDAQSLDEVSVIIDEDCKYNYSEGNYQGRKPIVSIYRQNYLQSQKIFDELLCSSKVEEISDNIFRINFTDKIRKGHSWHTYNFFEIIEFKNDMIITIQNCQIPGEDESMGIFYKKIQNINSAIL